MLTGDMETNSPSFAVMTAKNSETIEIPRDFFSVHSMRSQNV
jgi:hypothetical protein